MGVFKSKVDERENDKSIKEQVDKYLDLKREMERLFQQALRVRTDIGQVKGNLIALGCDDDDLAEIASLEQAWVEMVNSSLEGIVEV